MATGRAKLTGAKQLARALKAMPKAMAGKVALSAVRAGARVIQKDAITRLGADGDKKSVLVRKATKRDAGAKALGGTAAVVNVGINKEQFHLMFREFGTAPHLIGLNPRRGRKLLADRKTGQAFGTAVQHPGQTADPFFTPAFDTSRPRAFDAMGKSLAQGIKRVANKLAGPRAKSGLRRR